MSGLSSGDTTALIHRLEECGDLTRHAHPHDNRSILVSASDAVPERAEALYAPLVQEMDQLAAQLTDAERALIGRYLTAVAQVSERHAARLHELLREHECDVIAPPAPGPWA